MAISGQDVIEAQRDHLIERKIFTKS